MFTSYLDNFANALRGTQVTRGTDPISQDDAFSEIIQQFNAVRLAQKNIYLIGNGGSSGIISHTAIDLLNVCRMRAQPLTDNSMLTCMANDYGYPNVFSQPLSTLFTEGDALIAVSSSGKSPNIVNAANLAMERQGVVVTLSGFKADNPLRQAGRYNFWLEADNYGVVEIGHSLLLHHLTDELGKVVQADA